MGISTVIVGNKLLITTAEELFALVELVQLFALAVSWHTIESEALNEELLRVFETAPDIRVPFLYQANARALTFSVSESMSENTPMLHVRVLFLKAGEGVIEGDVKDEAWSG
jgi:hypothetical protein